VGCWETGVAGGGGVIPGCFRGKKELGNAALSGGGFVVYRKNGVGESWPKKIALPRGVRNTKRENSTRQHLGGKSPPHLLGGGEINQMVDGDWPKEKITFRKVREKRGKIVMNEEREKTELKTSCKEKGVFSVRTPGGEEKGFIGPPGERKSKGGER